MEQITYKNETVAAIAKAMDEGRADFEAKRAGQQWRAIIMTVATTFPEDREALFALFGRKTEAEQSEGEPTLHRRTKKGGRRTAKPCVDCPDSHGLDTGLESAPMRHIKAGKEATNVPAHESPSEAFATVEAVLERFDNDSDIMRTYCSRQGIDIGNAKTANGIAKKIVHHFNPPTE